MSLPHQPRGRTPDRPHTGQMIVCGDDALAGRLAAELREVYAEHVTLVVPAGRGTAAPGSGGPGTVSALVGRMSSAVTRNARATAPPSGRPYAADLRVLEAAEPDDGALQAAGIAESTALALVYDDDERNIGAALVARRLNPRLRLVIRLYNRKLGQHLEELLDQAAAVAAPDLDRAALDASTTVLSDADTAAPALAATAVAGTSKIVHAAGLLLRAVERTPPGPGRVADPGLCTLALLSSTTQDPAGAEGSDRSGGDAPQLLPDERAVAAATGRGTIVLEAITHASPAPASRLRRRATSRGVPLGELFSRRFRWSLFGAVAAVLALSLAAWRITADHPLHAAYLILLDVFSINDPAVEESAGRQILQILSGFAGLLLLPLLVAGILEAFGTFRSASQLRRPPRGLSGHVVLLGLGKVGTRVLARLRELDIPVVCVESDPLARGLALARRHRVPVVLGDVTDEGVLEAAKVHRAHAFLALTSVDTTNLEAALYARSVKPDLRVALRLYDDDFATAVFRTLRAAHPGALTRSRSVSTLAAPAFAGAMMGRQVLGAIPVERRVLLFAALDVAGHPLLEGRTVAEAFRAGAWRVLALDPTDAPDRAPDLASPNAHEDADGAPPPPGLVWDLHPGYVLRPEDRVLLATTRGGLAELLVRSATRPSGTG
ncbi:NAD-binding protein [Streptomyces sp. CA-294286]|uniref:potassium channel family protein n=1 Tax=Streptomyces sp. CA-294286 TaxID=3240070 RepID=UPI003D910762